MQKLRKESGEEERETLESRGKTDEEKSYPQEKRESVEKGEGDTGK